jgi:hypothetical protein
MPLKKGKAAKSRKGQSANIRTLVKDYQKKGRIGASKPKSKAAAVRQAVAISYKLAGRAKAKRGGKKK